MAIGRVILVVQRNRHDFRYTGRFPVGPLEFISGDTGPFRIQIFVTQRRTDRHISRIPGSGKGAVFVPPDKGTVRTCRLAQGKRQLMHGIIGIRTGGTTIDMICYGVNKITGGRGASAAAG